MEVDHPLRAALDRDIAHFLDVMFYVAELFANALDHGGHAVAVKVELITDKSKHRNGAVLGLREALRILKIVADIAPLAEEHSVLAWASEIEGALERLARVWVKQWCDGLCGQDKVAAMVIDWELAGGK